MLLILALLGGPCEGADTQTVRIEVSAAWKPAGLRLEAETVWLGQARSMELKDDGTVPEDHPGDGVYSGLWMGAPPRMLPLHIYASAPDLPRTELVGSNQVVDLGSSRLAWSLENDGHVYARKVALALPDAPMEVADTAAELAALGWIALVFIYVTWLVQRLVPRRRR